MRAYLAFTKKEYLEYIRTYKLLILLAAFLVFGIMSPLTAKLMPYLFETLMTENVQITMAEPSALDSYTQFFGNISQMGFIVLIILFCGFITNELNRGTLIHIITKGLKRSTVILSKFTAAFSLWTFSYLLSFLVCYGYTLYFWEQDNIKNLFFSIFCLWLYGVLLLSVVTFSSILCKSSYITLLFTGLFVVILSMINLVPKSENFNPIMLSSANISLLSGVVNPNDLLVPIIISTLLIVIFLLLAIKLFDKKQI